MKASNPLVMVQAYRLLSEEMYLKDWDYPLHLGVTEVKFPLRGLTCLQASFSSVGGDICKCMLWAALSDLMDLCFTPSTSMSCCGKISRIEDSSCAMVLGCQDQSLKGVSVGPSHLDLNFPGLPGAAKGFKTCIPHITAERRQMCGVHGQGWAKDRRKPGQSVLNMCGGCRLERARMGA